MDYLNKIFQQEVFQGNNKKRKYFEGWYFKNTNEEYTISFIPGINIDEKGNKSAFIQVISKEWSENIQYKYEDFVYTNNPFSIRIGDNIFSKEGFSVNIYKKNLDGKVFEIKGNLKYTENIEIEKNILSPNIMGPFAYIPFMECNHGCISLDSKINGELKINRADKIKKIDFNNGKGYIEKDYGTSFPKNWVWIQANSSDNLNIQFFLSIAKIPFLGLNFKGIIGILKLDKKEYRFATYNCTKLKKFEIIEQDDNKVLKIELKKRKYILEVEAELKDSHQLIAPIKGNMSKNIKESLNANVKVKFIHKDKVLFEGISNNCGLEVSNE